MPFFLYLLSFIIISFHLPLPMALFDFNYAVRQLVEFNSQAILNIEEK